MPFLTKCHILHFFPHCHKIASSTSSLYGNSRYHHQFIIIKSITLVPSILVTVVIINWNFRGPRTHSMPNWIRVIMMIIKWIKSILVVMIIVILMLPDDDQTRTILVVNINMSRWCSSSTSPSSSSCGGQRKPGFVG